MRSSYQFLECLVSIVSPSTIFVAFIVLFLTVSAPMCQQGTNTIIGGSAVIPLNRRPPVTAAFGKPWSPGISGGIPFYPNCVNVRDYGAAGSGVVDDSSAFNDAIAVCTNGGAVYVPPGDYRLNSPINFNSAKRFVLRGGGATQTRLLLYSDNYPFEFGGDTSR